VLDHIHDNPAGDLSLDALADVAAMSRFHWHRVFHAMTGETAAQAVRRIRLHRAAVLLVQSELPLADIAARTAPGETAPADFAAEAPQTPGNGLDRLAAFVTVARTTPDDDRPRLRPAINALRRLKERMERPVDGTHG